MTEEPKLTYHEKQLLKKLSPDVRLARETALTDEAKAGGEFVWRLEPSGKPVGPKSAFGLVLKGAVRPFDTGLFGDDCAQQFVPSHVGA